MTTQQNYIVKKIGNGNGKGKFQIIEAATNQVVGGVVKVDNLYDAFLFENDNFPGAAHMGITLLDAVKPLIY